MSERERERGREREGEMKLSALGNKKRWFKIGRCIAHFSAESIMKSLRLSSLEMLRFGNMDSCLCHMVSNIWV